MKYEVKVMKVTCCDDCGCDCCRGSEEGEGGKCKCGCPCCQSSEDE